MSTFTGQALSDERRLQALRRSDLLDTLPEESLDRYTRTLTELLGVPVSLVSIVDTDRQFFKSAHGLNDLVQTRSTPLSHSFCQHVVTSGRPLVVPDAHRDPLVRDNLAIQDLNVVAYLGYPIVTEEGFVLGSFCAIDSKPRQWNESDMRLVEALSFAVSSEVQLRIEKRSLEKSLTALRELQVRQEHLVHSVVHDLRTPLASILSAADLIELQGDLTPEQLETLGMAKSTGEQMLHLIGDMLDLFKAENITARVLNTGIMFPEDCVNRALSQVHSLAKLHEIELVPRCEFPLPAIVADSEKLVRVLVNLIGNAIKFTPPQGQVHIHARFDLETDRTTFSVQDSGIGIPADQLPFIFDRFNTQHKRTTFHKLPSTGLGLAFVKQVVEAHGGEITVTSVEGKGSCFTFWVPLEPAQEALQLQGFQIEDEVVI